MIDPVESPRHDTSLARPAACSDATITFSPRADQRPPIPPRAPRRDQIAHATRGFLRRGDPRKADLLLVDQGQRLMVVKDFSAKSWHRRLLGRLQILREYRAYRRAGPLLGLPALIGRVDGLALALERVDGVLLAKAPDRHSRAESHLAELRRLLDRLHAAGLFHLDLRGKSNVLLRPDGRLVIVDLAAAIWFRPGSLGNRLLSGWFALADETAWLKWKARLLPQRLTPAEWALLKRFRLLRILWFFNRNHPWPRELPPRKAGRTARRTGRRGAT